MKKILILIVIVFLLVGCGKEEKETLSPEPSQMPTINEIENLADRLDKTTNQEERTKILAEMQVILDRAEEMSKKK